jgi:methylglutaconyl-CoA hydratase
MDTPFVNIQIDHKGVGIITFFHPSSNSLPSDLLEKLEKTILKAGEDPSIKVILLQSQGKTFCAGASFDELLQLNDHEEAVEFFLGFARIINAMRKTPKFIITKVQGKVVGGGVGIIAASDYVMASEKAAVKLSELSIGIGPFVIAPAVKRKIGIAGFAQMSINSTRWHNAYWAKNKGLYTEVWDNSEQLNNETSLLLEKLSGYDPIAMKKIKQEIWEGTEHWDELLAKKAEISASLILQEYAQQKITQLKRK